MEGEEEYDEKNPGKIGKQHRKRKVNGNYSDKINQNIPEINNKIK